MPHSSSRNLVFIHGFLGGPEDWSAFETAGFASRFVTLPGHQMTPLPKGDCLLNGMIESLEEQMPSEKITLIGYSLGGRLALHYAKKYPEQISSLILLSANPGLEGGRAERQEQDRWWANYLQKEGLSDFLKRWYAQPLFGKLDWEALQQRKTHNPQSLARVLEELSPAVTPSYWNELEQFPFKTFFLFGAHDRKYLKIAAKLRELGQHVTVDLVSGASHAIHLENPKECCKKISEYLKGEQ